MSLPFDSRETETRRGVTCQSRARGNPGTLRSQDGQPRLCPHPRPFSTPVPPPAWGLGATPSGPLWGQTESTGGMRGLLASPAPARAPAALWAAGRAPPPGPLEIASPRHQPERPAGERSTDPEPHLHRRAGSGCARGPPAARMRLRALSAVLGASLGRRLGRIRWTVRAPGWTLPWPACHVSGRPDPRVVTGWLKPFFFFLRRRYSTGEVGGASWRKGKNPIGAVGPACAWEAVAALGRARASTPTPRALHGRLVTE